MRSARPTMMPACGPPRSLSPLKVTRSAPWPSVSGGIGARQAAQQRLDVMVAIAAVAFPEIELEIGGTLRGRHHGGRRRRRKPRASEIRMKDGAGEIEDRTQQGLRHRLEPPRDMHP